MIGARALAFDLGLYLLGEARIRFDVQELINSASSPSSVLRAGSMNKIRVAKIDDDRVAVRQLAPLDLVAALSSHSQHTIMLYPDLVLDLLGERRRRRLGLAGAAAHFFWLPFLAARWLLLRRGCGWALPRCGLCSGQPLVSVARRTPGKSSKNREAP